MINLFAQFNHRMQAFPRHTFSPCRHGFDIHQQGSIPMVLKDPPTAFYRVILAVIRRIVQQLDGFADMVNQLRHPFQKLSAHTAAFRTIVSFDLNEFRVLLLLWSESVPPSLKGIRNEVAGFIRTAKANVHNCQLSSSTIPQGMYFSPDPIS